MNEVFAASAATPPPCLRASASRLTVIQGTTRSDRGCYDAAMPWTAKAASIDGAHVPYLEAGDPRSSRVIVLVHAFPVGMWMWEPVAVPEGWRALAPALPGFDGVDAPPAGATSVDDYARAVLAFMDHLEIDSAVIGGLSMGGYVSFALWRLARPRWRGLVLADTRSGADSEETRAGRQKLLGLVKARGSHGVAEEMLPKLLGETTRARQPQLVDRVRRLIEGQTADGIAAAIVRLRDRPDSTPLLGEIRVPTLVVVGEEDGVTPPSQSEQMHARLGDAQLARIPEAGHLSCMENPAAFNAAVSRFLTGFPA
jgi:3-oxoadipate enol-lactonase